MNISIPRLILAVILPGLFLGGCEQENVYAPPPPPTVTVSQPVQRAVTGYIEFTGSTEAFETVEVRARVPGFLQSVHFKEGTQVKQGDLLYLIDPAELQAALEKAEAELVFSKAEFGKADSEYLRRKEAFKKGAYAEAEVVAAKADRDAAKAAIATKEAAVSEARLNLGYTRITAPIDGRIGKNQVDVGSLVGQGEPTLLTKIEKYDPIYATFSLNELDLQRLLRERAAQRRNAKAQLPQHTQALELGLAGEAGYPHQGRLDFVDLGVDPRTGTILLRGAFPNPAPHTILPGFFVRIRAPVERRDTALLVPEVALGNDQGGKYVLVVNEQKQVEQRPVKTGALTDDGLRVIEGGLTGQEWVIVNGVQRARPGATVSATQAKPELAAQQP